MTNTNRATALPNRTLAVVAHGAGDLRLEEVALATAAPHEAIVEIRYGGICGSDLHYWQHGSSGESILRDPMVLGHEVVGVVVRAAADGSGPAAGTPVAVHPATPGPGSARYPLDRPNLSPGCTYLGSAARHPHTDGAFLRYATLSSHMLRPLPPELPLRRAALVEPASVAWHAVARAGDVRGKSALVIGAGPIGALAIAVLKRAGAGTITAVDMQDLPLEIATAVGASNVLQGTDTAAIAEVGADIVIEASGHHSGLNSAISGAMRGGRVVMVGMLPSGPQPLTISLAIARELELFGSFRFNEEITEVIEALADGSLAVDPIITHEFPLADALAAFEMARNSARSGKVLLNFGA